MSYYHWQQKYLFVFLLLLFCFFKQNWWKPTAHSVRRLLGDNFHSQVHRGLPKAGQVKGREQENRREKGEMSCLGIRRKLIYTLATTKRPSSGTSLCWGPSTALCISNSLIFQVFVSAKDRWSMTARQSEKLPSQGNLVEWRAVVIPVSWRMRATCRAGEERALHTIVLFHEKVCLQPCN